MYNVLNMVKMVQFFALQTDCFIKYTEMACGFKILDVSEEMFEW